MTRLFAKYGYCFFLPFVWQNLPLRHTIITLQLIILYIHISGYMYYICVILKTPKSTYIGPTDLILDIVFYLNFQLCQNRVKAYHYYYCIN